MLMVVLMSQASPELYGDNMPRSFTYWTVSSIIFYFHAKFFALLYQFKIHNIIVLSYTTLNGDVSDVAEKI